MKSISSVIQTITTRWTKVSRGAPMAVIRNVTPEVLDLPSPPVPASTAEVIWHDVHFVEPEFLKAEVVRYVALADVRASGLDLAPEPSGGIRVEVLGRRAFVVLPSEAGTVIYNWVEDVIEDAWRTSVYRKVVAHVACDVVPSSSLFRGRAVHFAKLLRDLA